MNSFWQQLEPMVLGALALIIPVAAGTAVAWLKSRARTWVLVKGAVRQAEDISVPGSPLTGDEKRQIATRLVQQVKPGMASARVSQMIEAVLPDVRRESDPPRTPRSG